MQLGIKLRITSARRLVPVIALGALGCVSGLAATLTWNGGGTDASWSTPANWAGATPANGDALVFGGAARLTNSNDWLTGVGAVTFSSGGFTTSGNALTLNGDFTSTGNNTWAVNSTFGAARTFTSTSGLLTLGGSLSNNNYLATIAGAGNTLISGVLGGAGGLTKTGTGTLTLSNSNTYTGATSITGGTLVLSADANLGTAPGAATPASLVIDGGILSTSGTFSINSNRGIAIGPSSGTGSGTFNVTSGELTYAGIITSNTGSGTGSLVKTGGGTLTLGGANLYSGNTVISAGTLKIANATAIPSGLSKGDVVLDSTLDLYGNSITVNGLSGAGTITSSLAGAVILTAGANNKSGAFNGVIQNGGGTLALTKTGTGTLTLGGNNTFTGGVTINGGILQLANAGALNSASPNSISFGQNAAVGTKLQLNGTSVTLGSLSTNAVPGSVILENANAAAATLTVNQALNTTFAGVLQNGSGGGALAITKSGVGTLTLSGTNTYTGNTTITGGTLALSNGSAIPDSGAVVLADTAGATLLLNAGETIGSLAGGGASGGNVNLQGYTLTTGGANSDTAYAGVISGTGSLVKTGTGAMTLARTSSYSGNTTIKNGTLTLGAANALPAGTLLTLGDGTTNTSGILKLNGFAQTLAGLTNIGGGNANRVINGSATSVSLTLNTAANSSFSGILGGPGTNENNFNLIKTGAGILTLAGVNTFSGSTSITQGTLSTGNLTNALGTAVSAVILGDATNAGTLSYTGNSTAFTRGFTVNAGGGEIDTTTSGQTLTLGTGNVATSGAFTLGGAGNTSITSNITGTGSLNKTGAGTVTLSGINTYSGATTIRNGTVVLAVNDTGLKSTTTLTLGDATANTNGILKLDGKIQTLAGLTVTGNGTGNRVLGGNAALSTLTLNIAGSNIFTGILGGTGSNDNNLALVKTGTGTLTLAGANTYSGGTTLSAGTLSISSANNLGATSGALNIGAATLQVTSSFASSRTINLTDAASGVSLAGGVTYTQAGNLTGGGALNFTGAGSSTSILYLTGSSNNYGGSTRIQTGNLMLGATNALPVTTNVTLYGGSKLTLNGYAQTLAGITSSGGGVNSVVNGKVSPVTFTIHNDTDTTFSGVLGGAGTNENTFALTKTGGGALTLGGSNTYSGDTTLSAGTLKTASAVALPSGTGKGNVSIGSSATLDLANSSITINGLSGTGIVTNSGSNAKTLTVGSNDQTSTFGGVMQDGNSALGLSKTGTGTLTLSGANTYSGNTSVTGGTLKIGNAAALPSGVGKGNFSLAGSLDLAGNSITLNGLSGNGGISSSVAGALTLSVGANNQTSSYSGAITNGTATSMALTKIGTGTLTLAGVGNNTYTGGTSISTGTLLLGNDRVLPTAGGVFVGAGGTLDINGRTGANAAMGGLTGTGLVTNGAANTGTITVGNGDVSSTFNGALQDGSSPLAMVKTGTGTLTLTPGSSNTFTGGITINGGVVQAGNANALNPAGSNVVLFGANTGTKLQLNGNAIAIAGLSASSTNPVVENASTTAATLTLNNSSNYSYRGVIQDGTGGGTLSLTKSGTGTQTLTGANSYTGGTLISGGILAVNTDTALGATSGLLTIGNGKLEAAATIASSTRNIAVTDTASSIMVDTGFTYTEAGVISGTGSLNKEGKGTMQISGTANTYSGGTNISAGLLDVTATSGTPLGQNLNTNNISVNAGGNLSLSATGNKGSNQTITVSSSSSALGGIGISNTSLTQAQLNGMFTDNTGGYGGVLSINNGISYNSAINLATFGAGDWYLGSASTGTFSGTAANLTVGAGGTYRLGGGGGTLSITGTNVLTGSNDLLVGSNLTNGNGAVIVNVAQSYTGKTTVTGGAYLSIGSDASLGIAPGSVTPAKLVLDNGILQARAAMTLSANRGIAIGPTSGSGTGTIDTNGYNVSYAGIMANNGAGTGGFTKTGSGALTLTGSNTYSGPTGINGGTLIFSALENLGAGASINFSGGTLQYASGNTADITARTVTLGSNGGTIDTNGINIAFANATAGTGSFSKTGAGTLTLNAVNAMGNITVSGGTLKLGVAGATPATSNLILSGGATFDINGYDTTVANLSSSTASTTVINSAAGTGKTLTVTNNVASTFAGILADNAGTGGTLALNKTGPNTLTLSGANTYSGGTTVGTGTLGIGSDANLGASPGAATPANIIITGGATLASSANLTIDANRGIAIGPGGTTAATLDPAAGTTLTYNGIISNSGSATGGLTKSNTTGTLVLGGANTYAGDTTVSGGTLKITNTLAIPSGTGKGNVSMTGTLDLGGNAITINGLAGSGAITSSVAGAAGITIGANDQGGTFSGAIGNGGGTVSITKTGSATLILSGTSTYSGGTTISGGILSIGTDLNLGAAPGAATPGSLVINGGTLATSATMTLNSNRGIAVGPASGSGSGTLAIGAGTTLTYGGIIANNNSGTGGLTKTNTTGTLVLSGANTYSGDTAIAGGTLRLGNVAAIPSGTGKGNLTLSSGVTLDLNNLSPTVNGLSGAGTITNALTGAVTFTAGANGADGSFSGVIQDGNGTVALTKIGAGALVLGGINTYSGNTTVSNGTLQLGIASALPSGSGKGNLALNGTLDLAGFPTTVNGLSGSGLVTNSSAAAATLTAGAADQTSTFAGNIQSGAGTVALTKTGTGTLTLSGINTFSGATTLNTGTLAMGSTTGLSANSSVTINSGGTLDVNGYSITIDGLLGTGSINNNGGSAATLTAGASGNTTTFGGVIADGTSAIALTKTGAGTLALTGVNTYSGVTTIQNGTVSTANPGLGGNLGTATSAVILGDASHQGILSYTGNADLTFTRGFEVNAGGGQMNITSPGKTLTLQTGGVVSTAGTFTLGGAGNVVLNSVISGSGGFTKANTGTLLVNSVNTYAGDTTISSGTLQISNAAALPSSTGKGNLVLNGTLDVNNLSITVNGLSGAGTITNTAGSPVTLTAGGNNATGAFTGVLLDGNGITSLTKTGTGTLHLGGVNTYSGDTTISGGTLQIGNAYAIASGPNKGNVSLGAAGTLDLHDFNLTLNGLSGGGTVTNNSGASVLFVGANDQSAGFSGSIRDGNGTIGLTKTGAGTLSLSGNNTFSGATTISGGSVSVGSDTALSSRSTLTIDNAGTLDLNGHVIAIDGLAGTGSITNNNAAPVTLTTGASGGSGVFGGTIHDGTGVIALTKTGAGTVTLSSVNSYSGGTTVTGGLLAITSTGALGAIPATPTPGNIVLNGGGISATNTFEINSNRGIAVGPAAGSGLGILDAAQNQTLTYNGIIANNDAGTGGLTKTGLGTVSLGGVNTYSDNTTVAAGSLQIGGALAIPSGTNKGDLALATGTTLDLNNTSITINGLSGTGVVSNTKTGTVTLNAGANNQTGTFDGLIENGNGRTALNKVGTGTLTLTGSNTHTGGTTITEGGLGVATSAALGLESNNLTIDAGATLLVTGSFNTSRTTTLGGAGGGTGGTFEVISSNKLDYTSSSVISGTGSLIKTGAGTLSIGGLDTYTGGTYIKEGTLVVTSGLALGPLPASGSGNYAVHIYNGATIQLEANSWTSDRQLELVGGTANVDVTNGVTIVRNGSILGGGTMNSSGAGTLIINNSGPNANTYTGGTIVENGVLQVNNTTGSATGSGAVTVRNGGTLSGLTAQGGSTGTTGSITGTVEITGTGGLLARSGGTLTLGGLTLDAGSLSSFQLGALTGTPVVNITGAGALALSGTSTRTIDILNTGSMAVGTYHLFDYTGTAFADDYTYGRLALADAHSGLFNLSLVNNAANTSIDLGVTAIEQQWKKAVGNSNWSDSKNWWTGVVPNGVGAAALFMNNNGDAGFGTTETVTLDANVTVGSIAFNNADTAFTIHAPGTQTLTLDETSGDAVIQIFSPPNTAHANNVIDASVMLAHDLSIGIASGDYGLDISGAISGDGKTLTKTGAGPLTLSGAGANTHGGLTEVVEGTLKLNKTAGVDAIGAAGLQIDYGGTVTLLTSNQIADDAWVTVNGTFALGTYSETITGLTGGGSVTTGNGSVLTIAGDASSIFLGTISGTGGIAKAGVGTLTLNGTNTYTGGTTIREGIVEVGADHNLGGAGDITFDGGTLFFSGGFTSERNILLNSGGGTLDTDGSDVILAGLISGTGRLTKTGIGTVTLNTANNHSGATLIESGILRISNTLSLGTTAGGTTVNTGGELELYGNGLTVNEPLTLNGGEVCTLLGTNTYNGSVTLTADSVIDADSDKLIITSGIGQSGGSFGLTKSGPGIVELTGTNSYTGATRVEEGALSLFNGAAIADTGAVILANAPDVLLLLNASETTGSLAGGGTSGGNVQLGSNTLTAGDASNTTFSGIISGTGGALTKQGTGTLTLSGANTYSGATLVNEGVLNIQNATALGTSQGSTTVAGGAALQIQGNITVGAETITLNGTGINATGALRNLSGTNTYEGLVTLGSATRINSDAGSLTLANTGTITGSYGLTIGGAGDTSIRSSIGTGSGTLTKDGSGILTLSGANTYTGNTTVSAGTLRMDNPLAIPSGTGKGNLSLAANATLDLNNTRITLNGLSGPGRVTNTGTGTAALTVGANDQTSTFGGVIGDGEGMTALTKTGTGTLTLTGANSYTGGTTVEAGTLRISADSNLGHAADAPTPGDLVIQAGATLAATATFTLDSHRGIAVGPGGAGIIDVADARTLTYGGTIADNGGSGGISKTGQGTLVLTGTSSHTGATTVAAGVLTVNGSLGDTMTTVAAGATLGGNGTLGGATTINSGGFHAPGDPATNGGIGIQSFSSTLNYDTGAIFEWDLSGARFGSGALNQGTYDQVQATGAITVLSGAIFQIELAGSDFADSFWDTPRTWDNIFTGSGTPHLFNDTNGTFTGFGGSSGWIAADGTVAGEGKFSFDGSTLIWLQGEFSSIPEPGNWLVLCGLVGTGVCLRTRRRVPVAPGN